MPVAQAFLLAAYRVLRRPLRTGAGRRLFLWAYALYKHREARDLDALRPYVHPGSTVIDVGANVGYFTARFADWVTPAGRVLAIEPESVNAADLRRAMARAPQVECLAVAASDRAGAGHLRLNPVHPADHRLSTGGEPIRLETIDGLMDARHWPPVSLIKIDVQGAELVVIDGAVRTIERSRPALYIEFDDEALQVQGASARALATRLESLEYAPYRLVDRQPMPVDVAWIQQASHAGKYVDVLWLSARR